MHLKKTPQIHQTVVKNITSQLIILIIFILRPKTPIQRKSLKIVNNFILTKRISLIKHSSSKSLFHTQVNFPQITKKQMYLSRSKKHSSNNINNFVNVPLNILILLNK